jgi:signal transduction histidine kinase
LGGTTLVAGAASLVEEARHNTTVDVELRVPETPLEPPSSVTAEVLAVLNEALSNVARHSRATRAAVEIRSDDDGLQLTVVDNGVGIPPERIALVGHQGMRNMRERTERLGGRLDVESEPGSGTRVRMYLPPGTGGEGERMDVA